MKDITRMLHSGNLTARERFILLIQNEVQKTKTGKDILTPADKDALENWKAKNNEEAREWNRLNDGWKHTGKMEIEVELLYKDAKIMYLAQLPIIFQLLYYPTYRQMKKCIDTLENIPKVTIDYAAKIAAKQREVKMAEGLDFDYAVYCLAFELLSEADKKHMVELYPDIKHDHQYLDQEEIIANLFGDKDELTPEAKEKLASLVAERCYNEFAKEYQLFHYFACIPLIEVAKYFLKMKGVEIKSKAMSKNQEADDEDSNTCHDITATVVAYATQHNIKIEHMLKEGCLAWLDDGLIDAYTPLAVSTDNDLLKRWFDKKKEALSLLRKYITDGKLKLRERTSNETTTNKLYSKNLCSSEYRSAKEIIEYIGMDATEKGEIDEKKAFENFSDSVITGESLYDFTENYEFVKDFRTRVDNYDANLGIVYAEDNSEQKCNHLDREFVISSLDNEGKPVLFSMHNISVTLLAGLFDGKMFFEESIENEKIYLKFKDVEIKKAFEERRQSLIENYARLLAFKGLFNRLSKIYEADLTYHVDERIGLAREDMEQFNKTILVATNVDEKAKNTFGLFKNKETLYFKDDQIINIDDIEPDNSAIQEHEKKLMNILGDF